MVILDLAGVETAASAAISAIVDASNQMREKGGVHRIDDPHPHVLKRFKRQGLHQTLWFFQSSRHRGDKPTKKRE